GWLLLLVAAAVNEMVIARFLSVNGTLADVTLISLRVLDFVLVGCGVILLVESRGLSARIGRLGLQLRESTEAQSASGAVTALALVVPWLVTAMVAESGGANRYNWLWPVQMIFVVAAVTYVPRRLRWPRSVAICAQATLVIVL